MTQGSSLLPHSQASIKWIDKLLFFSWWVNAQQRVEAWPKSRRYLTFALVVLAGVLARLWAQSKPGNWDFGQWINISTAALAGQDPYSTFGYNYPPPWLGTLTFLNWITDSTGSFRLAIALLLTAADVGIAIILMKRGYTLASWLFLLSPITITISGQHQQVESIALLLAFGATALLATSQPNRVSGTDAIAALLLGLSLAFKPIFLLFPIWLLFRKTTWSKRIVVGVVPLVVFGASILSAFLFYPPSEVLRRILGHNSMNDSPFINAFAPQQLVPWLLDNGIAKLAFVTILLFLGLYFRNLPPFEMALAYTISAVLFSWAVANQYLATPMSAVAVYLNLGFLIWLSLVTIYFGGASDILNLWVLRDIQPHLLLEYNQVMQDFFPWLCVGWIIYMIGQRRSGSLYIPSCVRMKMELQVKDR